MASSNTNSVCFASAMDSVLGSNPVLNIGENGAVQHTMDGMSSSIEEYKGYAVALWNKLAHTGSVETQAVVDIDIEKCFRKYMRSLESFPKEIRANACADIVVAMFQTRDPRGGKGSRMPAYRLFELCYEQFPHTMLNTLPLLPEYGRWLDLFEIIVRYAKRRDNSVAANTLRSVIYDIISSQLEKDLEELEYNVDRTPVLSLLGKWLPRQKSRIDRQTRVNDLGIPGACYVLASRLNPVTFAESKSYAMKLYREACTKLNRALDIPEVKMCARDFHLIDFKKVAGRALNLYRRAFLNQQLKDKDAIRFDDPRRMECKDNFTAFLQLAAEGKVNVKGKSMFLTELVQEVFTNDCKMSEAEHTLLEAQWQSHVRFYRELMEEKGVDFLSRGLVCADVSSSMSGTPMMLSIAMAIFVSQFAQDGPWKNKFLTFNSEPSWVDISRCSTFREAVHTVQRSPWGGSTDVLKMFDLILEVCIRNRLTQDQLPKWFMIVTDGQFDVSGFITVDKSMRSYPNLSRFSGSVLRDAMSRLPSYRRSRYSFSPRLGLETTHEIIVEAFRNAGYTAPEFIYWNARPEVRGFPVQADTPGTQMVSGFSTDLLKLFLEGSNMTDYEKEAVEPPTPWDTFRKAIDDERYNAVRLAIESAREIRGYTAPVIVEEAESVDTTAAVCGGAGN